MLISYSSHSFGEIFSFSSILLIFSFIFSPLKISELSCNPSIRFITLIILISECVFNLSIFNIIFSSLEIKSNENPSILLFGLNKNIFSFS